MILRAILLRIVCVLGILLAPVPQMAMADAPAPALHHAMMSVAEHANMMMAAGAVRDRSAVDAATWHKAALDFCMQHCLAVPAILPSCDMPSVGEARTVQLKPRSETSPVSLNPDPTGPPPKSRAI